jgi:hypothetical protein
MIHWAWLLAPIALVAIAVWWANRETDNRDDDPFN